jgi:hypothetical protein
MPLPSSASMSTDKKALNRSRNPMDYSLHDTELLSRFINPLSPPSAPVQMRLQPFPAKSNFLAVGEAQRSVCVCSARVRAFGFVFSDYASRRSRVPFFVSIDQPRIFPFSRPGSWTGLRPGLHPLVWVLLILCQPLVRRCDDVPSLG